MQTAEILRTLAEGQPIAEAEADALEDWMEHGIDVPEPDEEACRRWYAAHGAQLARGERVHARHVLFAVTPGVDVNALRQRAEAMLLDLRSPTPADGDRDARFAAAARAWSNCPSGAEGGTLGWLVRDDCAPEFAAELFGRAEVGVLPRLVHSRFGLHVVEVLGREAGELPTFEAVRPAVVQALRRQAWANAVRRQLQQDGLSNH